MAVYFTKPPTINTLNGSSASATVYFNKQPTVTTLNGSDAHNRVYFTKQQIMNTLHATGGIAKVYFTKNLTLSLSPKNITIYYVHFNIYEPPKLTNYTSTISDTIDKLQDYPWLRNYTPTVKAYLIERTKFYDVYFDVVEPAPMDIYFDVISYEADVYFNVDSTTTEYNVYFDVINSTTEYDVYFDVLGDLTNRVEYDIRFDVGAVVAVEHDVEFYVIESWAPVKLNLEVQIINNNGPTKIRHRFYIKLYQNNNLIGTANKYIKSKNLAEIQLRITSIPNVFSGDNKLVVYDNGVKVYTDISAYAPTKEVILV